MQNQITSNLQKSVFGDYQIGKQMPFRIVQAPFRRFPRYNRDGHWNQKERLKYTVFIQFFREIFDDPNKKKQTRLYQMMSDMIVTRNPNQCRSHHQKMEKDGKGITEIIASVVEKYQPRVFKEIQEKYLALIKTLLQNSDKYIRITNTDEPRKPKLRRELTFLQSQLQHLPLPKRSLHHKLDTHSDKIAFAKTDDKYEEEEYFKKPVLEDDQDNLPLVDGPLKEECEEEDLFYREIAREQTNKKVPDMQNLNSIPTPDYLSMFAGAGLFTSVSRAECEQLLKRVEYQKQWHVENVNHLKRQQQNEEKAIQLCNARIKFLKESFDNMGLLD